MTSSDGSRDRQDKSQQTYGCSGSGAGKVAQVPWAVSAPGWASFQPDTWGSRKKIVLLNFRSFREFGAFDGAIYVERERQLTVNEFCAFQSGDSVGEKTLFGGDCRHTLIVEFVGAGYAYATRAVHIDAVAVNIDGVAGNAEVLELNVRGNRAEGCGIFFGGADVVEMSQLHEVCVEHQAWDLTVGDLQVPGSTHSREWTGG